MEKLRQGILRRFLTNNDSVSRNRNFESYKDEKIRRAVKACHLLKSLRSDILDRNLTYLRLVREDYEGSDDRYAVCLGWRGGSRMSFLTEEEVAVLREDPKLSTLI